MQEVLDSDEQGYLVRRAGIMGVVIEGGLINIGADISVVFPASPLQPFDTV